MPVSGSTRPGTPTPIARDVVGRGAGVGEGARRRRRRSRRRRGPGRRPRSGRRGAAEDALVASTTRTAILVPPMSTPTRSGRSRPSTARGRSSMHRQAELAGQQQRARAEERQVLADAAVDDAGLARERAEAAAGGLVADGRQPRLAEGGDRAVDDDLADVEDADQVRDRGAEGPAGGARRRPARSRRLRCGRGGQLGECRGCGGRRPRRRAGSPGRWPRSRGSRTGRSGTRRRRARRRCGRSRRRRRRRRRTARRRGRGRRRCRARP